MGYGNKNSLIVSFATRSASFWHNNIHSHTMPAAQVGIVPQELSNKVRTCSSGPAAEIKRVRLWKWESTRREHWKPSFFSPAHTALSVDPRARAGQSLRVAPPLSLLPLSFPFDLSISLAAETHSDAHTWNRSGAWAFFFVWKKIRRHSTRPLFPVPRMCCIFFHQIHILLQMRVGTNGINYS